MPNKDGAKDKHRQRDNEELATPSSAGQETTTKIEMTIKIAWAGTPLPRLPWKH